jgi:hypothetical protein
MSLTSAKPSARAELVSVRGESKSDTPSEEVSTKSQHLWFISDAPLSKNLSKQLTENQSSIRTFNAKQFTNVSPATMLNDNKVQHMWTNIKNADALEYVSRYISGNDSYTVVLCHSSHKNAKHQKWISDLMSIEGAIDIKTRTKDLTSIAALTHGDLVSQIQNKVVISAPASTIGSIFGSSSRLKKKAAR